MSSWISSIPNLLTEEVEHNAPRTTSTVSLPDTEEVLGAVTQQVDLYSRKVRIACLLAAVALDRATNPAHPCLLLQVDNLESSLISHLLVTQHR